MKLHPRSSSALYIRNFIFGVEDSLVSTVGLLSGVAIADVEKKTILLTGIILIFVEAFSMAVGSFLSEHSAEDYVKQAEVKDKKAFTGAVVMFLSYFFSGFIPLFPYILSQSVSRAFPFSIGISIAALFVLGMTSGKLSHTNVLRYALRMAFIGGIAIAVGVLISTFLQQVSARY